MLKKIEIYFNNNMENTFSIYFTDEEKMQIMELEEQVDKFLNFPSEGIFFHDIFSLLRKPDLTEILFVLSEKVINEFNKNSQEKINCIVGIEARGFLLGMVLAHKLKLPFVALRKKNKLPGDVYSISYTTEYSCDCFELQKKAIDENSKILIIDDLLATGGTIKAAEDLIDLAKSKVIGIFTIFEIEKLNGKQKLSHKNKFFSLIKI